MTEQELFTLARAYSAHTGHSLSTIGAYALQNSRFFTRLSRGGSCTLKTATRLNAWFSENWPADLAWPETAMGQRNDQ